MTGNGEPARLAGRPVLLVVAGPPEAGKSTLAHALGPLLRCPVVSRDEIKEGLVTAAGGEGGASDALARAANAAFFATLDLLIERGVSVVAEAAFQHRLWHPGLEPLVERARIRIVLCTVAPEIAARRRIERFARDPERERYHPESAGSVAGVPFDPPRLDVPTLIVDARDGDAPDLAAIVAFARG